MSLQFCKQKPSQQKQCVWIGTMHKRKGFNELITIANRILTMYLNAL